MKQDLTQEIKYKITAEDQTDDAVRNVLSNLDELIAEARKRTSHTEVAQAEEAHEERIAEIRKKNEEEVQQRRLANIREAEAAEKAAASESAAAHARLAAAQGAVKQAWGWYRDKDSLKSQIEEEKANAAAEKQFEKEFDKLRFRRDWREATNLSLDQEAVRRVALAREEEDAAQKAVTSIDQKMSDVVEELRKMTEDA